MPSLTGLQLSVMRVLWERGEASIADVQKALMAERGLAQTTVATLLSRLEKRGVVAHRVDGRQFIYRATVDEPDVRHSMVADLTDALFGGDPAQLISHLLTTRDIRPGDLDRVRELIEARDSDGRESGGGDGR